MDLALALSVGGGVAAFVEVVVDLVDAAGAGFADFAGVGGEFGGVGLGDGGRFWGVDMGVAVSDALVDEIRGVLAHGVGDVAVDVDGGGGADVADDGGEGLDVHAVLQSGGGEGVTEVVKPNILTPGPLQGLFHFVVDALRVHGAGAAGGGEQPLGVRPLPEGFKDVHHCRGQDHGAVGAFRLGLGDLERAVHVNGLAFDVQGAGLEVQIIPLEGANLSPAHPRGQLQKRQLKEAVLLCLNQEPLHLLVGQHLHLGALFRRQLAPHGGVDRDQPLRHGLFQRRVAGGVAGAHHAVGESRPVYVRPRLAPGLFELGVELLEVALPELVQRYLSQPRNDVLIDAVFVGFLRRDPQARLGVRLVPQVHPLPEGHTGPCLAGHDATLGSELFQLFKAFLLCVGEDAFRLRSALFVVFHDHTTFPATVLAEPQRALTGFSAFCHGLSSSPNNSSINPPTISAAFSCIPVVTWV